MAFSNPAYYVCHFNLDLDRYIYVMFFISVYKTLHYMIINTLDNRRLFRYCLGYLLFRYSPWYNAPRKNRWLPELVIILPGSCFGSLGTYNLDYWGLMQNQSSRLQSWISIKYGRLPFDGLADSTGHSRHVPIRLLTAPNGSSIASLVLLGQAG